MAQRKTDDEANNNQPAGNFALAIVAATHAKTTGVQDG
jgi:hypothetical protein